MNNELDGFVLQLTPHLNQFITHVYRDIPTLYWAPKRVVSGNILSKISCKYLRSVQGLT